MSVCVSTAYRDLYKSLLWCVLCRCVAGNHLSLSKVIPTSIISISHSSLSYRGGRGGWFWGVRWKKNTSHQTAAEKLFSLSKKAVKRVIVQPHHRSFLPVIIHGNIYTALSHTQPRKGKTERADSQTEKEPIIIQAHSQ